MKRGNRPLLVIGGPNAGKTHYGGQLLGRLNQRKGVLRMQGAPVNISPFEEVLKALGQGKTAGHTAMDVYHEVIMPIAKGAGETFELVFPDYNGEQVRGIMEDRHISREWQARLRESNGWLLFIRLELLRAFDDVFTRPVSRVEEGNRNSSDGSKWSDQAYFVELLQLLLFTKGVGTIDRVNKPVLTVVLSCWDEIKGLQKNVTPLDLLSKRMPLFAEFIQATWQASELYVVGLSALGRALQEKEADEEYKDRGPECFGYVVLPDGK
jgi:hypothetical protein